MRSERLKSAILGSFGVLAMTAVAVLAYTSVRYFEQNTVRQRQEQLLTIADIQSNRVEETLNGIRTDLEIAALSPAVKRRIRESVSSSESSSEDCLPLEEVFARLRQTADSFYRIDAEGIVRERVPREEGEIGSDFSGKPGVGFVLQHHKSHISGAFRTDSGREAVSICVPVLESQEFVGILRGLVYLDTLGGLLSSIRQAERTSAFIVNEDGMVIANAEGVIETNSILLNDLSKKGDERRESAVVSEILAGGEGAACLHFDELSYGKAVMAWMPIHVGEGTWSVVVCEDYDNITDSIRKYSLNVMMLVVCIGLVLVGVAMAVYRLYKKKIQLEALLSLNRMSEELQYISDERTQTVTELEKHDRLLKSIISAVPNGIFWKDLKNRYLGCNRKFAEMMGRDRQEDIIGKTDHEIEVNKDFAGVYEGHDREVVKTGIPLLNVQKVCRGPDGRELDLLISKVPLLDTSGKVTGVIGIFTDITELKSNQQEILAEGGTCGIAISVMEQGVIVTDMLGTILEANGYYCNSAGRSRDQLRGKSIYECITSPLNGKLVALIRDFHESSTCEPKVFNHGIGEKNYQIFVQPMREEERVIGAVINLIDVSELTRARERAEYSSFRQGRLLASLSHKIRTPMNSIMGFADLLEEEELTGEQANFARMIYSSAGNLLDVVNEIVQLSSEHPEDIPDEINESGEGAGGAGGQGVRGGDDVESSDSDSETCAGHGEDYRVLIVDDVAENRMLIEVLLKKNGYSTISCNDGVEAVNLCATELFDLILMDIQMPRMNGLEAIKIIRSEGVNLSTPILAMTASLDIEDEGLCLEAGCDDYIRKPIKKETLLKRVWRFSEQKKQIAAAMEGEEIVSFLHDNPDYHKAIEAFVENLPGRIAEMQKAFDEENLQDLRFKVHAMKGVGGFAGFPVYSELAKSMEEAIEESKMEDIKKKLDEMVEICRRTKLTAN